METDLTRDAKIELPIICGAMYPCSNPELVAAVSEAGGIGIIQPLTMEFVFKRDLRDGIRYIRTLTNKPIGINALVEKSSNAYEKKLKSWIDIAIEENIRFFTTAMGNPRWVVERAHEVGGVVYHDVTTKQWAQKGQDYGVDGLICVNNRAGGHAGTISSENLYADLSELKLPLVCAGGVGGAEEFRQAMKIGYAGVQMGTRFIASEECASHIDYKEAIVTAKEMDIGLTDKISGVPVSIILTEYVKKTGLNAGPLARYMLRGRKTKKWMRMIYSLQSFWKLKKSSLKGSGYNAYFQAGKSANAVTSIEPVRKIIDDLKQALE